MTRQPAFHWAALIFVLTALAGCAVGPVRPPMVSENQAVLALLESARFDLDEGRFPSATASLERALRIEPRNPFLWQELAQAHLRQGNYQQAESFAARSNSWAGSDKSLLAANWQIIAESRAKRGDDAGAQAAGERAAQLAK